MARSSCQDILPYVEAWKRDPLLIHTSENTQLNEGCTKIHWEVFLKIRTQLWWKHYVGDRRLHTDCLQGNQSLSINPVPCVTHPYSPSLQSGLEILCIPGIASLLELLRGTELTKLRDHAALCLYEGREGGEERSRMKKVQIMLLPSCGPFSKLLIFCRSFLLKSQHGLLADWDAFLCTHTPWCLYIITLSSHANSQHLCHY